MSQNSNKIIVEIIESEKGWGQKLDDIVEFDSLDKAKEYVLKYNSAFKKHVAQYHPEIKEGQTPDWYMYARIRESR